MSVIDFTMPSLGADMDAGTITEWMINAGDSVERGDIVAIVETDKADIDIEVWDSGTVTEIVVPVGELVAVGTPLARIELPAGSSSTPAQQQPPESSASQEAPKPPAAAGPPVAAAPASEPVAPGVNGRSGRPVTHGNTIAASPLVRRLAAEREIDLAELRGSGPGGAIIARDLTAVRPAAERSQSRAVTGENTAKNTAADERRPADGSGRMRRAIAELMTRSSREIPHYYLEAEVDLEAALTWLETVNADRPIDERILPAALIMKATAVALAKHPEFNGFWVDDGFRPGSAVHLGIAVSLRGGGLVAPAVRHADRLTVGELMTALRDLVGRARSGRLRASEMTDPTVTITNLGDRGVDVVHGVIYRPQVALIGVGRVSARPAVVDGTIVSRRRVTLTLAADHRASDGQRGARLLNTISRLLQAPEDL